MSDKYTEVSTPHGGIGEWGYVEPDEAIDRLRRKLERDKADADAALADITAGRVSVYHQLGPWARRNRHCVFAGEPRNPEEQS